MGWIGHTLRKTFRKRRESPRVAATRFGKLVVPAAAARTRGLRAIAFIGALAAVGGTAYLGTRIVQRTRAAMAADFARQAGTPSAAVHDAPPAIQLPVLDTGSISKSSTTRPGGDTSTGAPLDRVRTLATQRRPGLTKQAYEFRNVDSLVTVFRSGDRRADSAVVSRSKDAVVHYAFAFYLQSRQEYAAASREYRRFVELAAGRFSATTVAEVERHIAVLDKLVR